MRDWKQAAIVYIPHVTPVCPYCESQSFTITKTEKGGDGSIARKTVCNACSRLVLIVCEPTEPIDVVLPNLASEPRP